MMNFWNWLIGARISLCVSHRWIFLWKGGDRELDQYSQSLKPDDQSSLTDHHTDAQQKPENGHTALEVQSVTSSLYLMDYVRKCGRFYFRWEVSRVQGWLIFNECLLATKTEPNRFMKHLWIICFKPVIQGRVNEVLCFILISVNAWTGLVWFLTWSQSSFMHVHIKMHFYWEHLYNNKD